MEWGDPNITKLNETFDESQKAAFAFEGIVLDLFPWLWKLGIPTSVCKPLQKRIAANRWLENEIKKQMVIFK